MITEETHERLFGDRAASEQAIGERIGVKSRGALDLQVSGVMAMWPRTSSLRADLFISFTHWESFGRNNDWGSFAEVFVLTAPGTNRVTFESALQQFAPIASGRANLRLDRAGSPCRPGGCLQAPASADA